MIGAGKFAVVKPSAIIINTPHPVIDEKALTTVLFGGHPHSPKLLEQTPRQHASATRRRLWLA
jgi:hypothetical protein